MHHRHTNILSMTVAIVSMKSLLFTSRIDLEAYCGAYTWFGRHLLVRFVYCLFLVDPLLIDLAPKYLSSCPSTRPCMMHLVEQTKDVSSRSTSRTRIGHILLSILRSFFLVIIGSSLQNITTSRRTSQSGRFIVFVSGVDISAAEAVKYLAKASY